MAYKICAFYRNIHGAHFIAQMTMNARFLVAPNAYGANDAHQPINGTLHAEIIAKRSVQKQAGYQKNGQRDSAYP